MASFHFTVLNRATNELTVRLYEFNTSTKVGTDIKAKVVLIGGKAQSFRIVEATDQAPNDFKARTMDNGWELANYKQRMVRNDPADMVFRRYWPKWRGLMADAIVDIENVKL